MDKDTKKQFDSLTKIIEKGFNKAAKKADVDKRFDKAEKRMDGKIEDLAIIVNKGFEDARKDRNERFAKVDERFDKVEAEINEIKEDTHQIKVEVKQIWNKLDEIEKRLDKLSQTSKEDVDAIIGDVLNLKQRVDFLESQIKELEAA